MKSVAIVQARWGSKRLPGKVLKKLAGKSVLEHIVNRLRCVCGLDEVVIATSVGKKDQSVAREAERLGLRAVRGSEDNVLDRYLQAAIATSADVIVRITGDCPLIDSSVVEGMLAAFQNEWRHGRGPDYMSNVHPRTFPRGLDTEIFTRAALERAALKAGAACEREHVTPYFYHHPEEFVLRSWVGTTDQSRHRWTLDTAEDLSFLRKVFAALGRKGRTFSTGDMLSLLARRPELAAINAGVKQKSIFAKGD